MARGVRTPRDGLMLLDRRSPGQRFVLDELLSQEAAYRKQADPGWWGRLWQRSRQPRLVILQAAVRDEVPAD